MSDFLFSTARRPEGELRRALERYVGHVSASVEERHGSWGSLAVARGPADPLETLVDDGGSISVLIGDPVIRIAPEPPGLSRLGGRRRALHALLRGGPGAPWAERIDSGFAALSIDTARGGGMIVTDVGGFVPVFASRHAGGEGGWIAGTHLDAVARATGRSAHIDPVSAADLLANLTCTWPHTLYTGVEQLAPATALPFDADGAPGEPRAYWRPVETNPFASVRDAAAAVREALVEQVGAICRDVPEVALLLSGGEDARAVLGAVPEGVRVRAFVYADWENREVRVARAAARAYGATLTFGARTPDHYVDGLEPVGRMIGTHNNFMDVHGWGFHERLGLRGFPVVLGGLSSDSFLKAEHEPDRPARDAFDLPPASIIRPELLQQVVARRLAFRRWLAEFRPATATEWEKLWPFTQRKHSANLHGNRRMFASQEPYHANALVTLAAAIPAEWKHHRRLFHAAMKPLFRRSWAVPHSRWRFPYFGVAANLPLTAGLRITRGVRALVTGQVRARQQPWPKWRIVARSQAGTAKLHQYAGSPLRGVFTDPSPEAIIASIRGEWHPLRQLILVQLSYLARVGAEE
ncbi:asparagine synthase-related protein [Longimicrobium sp.]|uniref:asparagine synthase-related protein n=1 Tax=Longimicrobium sp. TaxID=2029185 RepID=UPI003B3A6008